MAQRITVKGRLVGPRSVELDEPAEGVSQDVEVTLHRQPDEPREGETVFDFLRRLPPGNRTKEDVDRQIREERDSWGDR